jgi:beta-N-acetylhexosaminidase
MSDDISMEALTGGIAERSEHALNAGCDLILHCNGDPTEMDEVASVVGALTGAALRRSNQALAARPKPEPLGDAAEEFETLMQGVAYA